MNNFNPILIETKITKTDVTNAKILAGKNLIFRKLPICPPINTDKNNNQ